MDKTYFLTQATYNRWANKKLYDVVETLSPADFAKDGGAYFKSIQGTLNHLMFGDWAWVLRLRGKSSAHLVMDKIYHADFASLKQARLEADEDLITFVTEMSDDFLSGTITYNNIQGVEYTMPVAMVLTHIMNHGTHHRAQVHTLLTQLGLEVPSLDLIYYLIECQAEA